MIGHPWQAAGFNKTTKTEVYLFNQTNGAWTPVETKFPCQIVDPFHSRFSCAYLKSGNAVVNAVEGCVATLSLNSLQWTSLSLGYQHGVVFNADIDREAVLYIGSNKTYGSFVYMVLYIRFLADKPRLIT